MGGVEVDLESRQRFGPDVGGAADHLGVVARGFGGKGSGKILHGDLAEGARLLVAEIGKGGFGRRRFQRGGRVRIVVRAVPQTRYSISGR